MSGEELIQFHRQEIHEISKNEDEYIYRLTYKKIAFF